MAFKSEGKSWEILFLSQINKRELESILFMHQVIEKIVSIIPSFIYWENNTWCFRVYFLIAMDMDMGLAYLHVRKHLHGKSPYKVEYHIGEDMSI